MDILERAVALARSGERCVLATVIKVTGSAPRHPGARMVVREGGATVGTVGGGEVEETTVAAAREMLAAGRPATNIVGLATECGGKVELFLEQLRPERSLLVVGAGHVGSAVARLAAATGFEVTVVDISGASHLEANPGVTVVEGGDAQVLDGIDLPPEAQVVVATGARDEDIRWAVAVLQRQFRGVGVVGSATKARAVWRAAEAAGIGPDRLSDLRCPVGVRIGSETPAELAVSVVAELVKLDRLGGDDG